MSLLYEQANFSVECGLHIFPCKPYGKAPSRSPWAKRSHYRSRAVEKWWGAQGTHQGHNIGCLPCLSDHAVVDVDIKKDINIDGHKSLKSLIPTYPFSF